MRSLAILLGLASSGICAAADLGVVVRAQDGVLHAPVAEAAVWHALPQRHGVNATMVPPEHAGAAALAQRGLSTLLVVDVAWFPVVVDVAGGGKVAPHVPQVTMSEWVVQGEALVEVAHDRAAGLPAVVGDRARGFQALPEIALQQAVWDALAQVSQPAWGQVRAPHQLPVQVTVDAAFVAAHGDAWEAEALARVAAGSTLLRDAGLALHVVHVERWHGALDVADLSSALTTVAAQPWTNPDVVIRVALTHRSRRIDQLQADDVGRAFQPGRDVVVVDQPAPVARARVWDVAETGVAVAHEVLHALGVPHVPESRGVMAAEQASLVWRMEPQTVALARAAGQARVAHWDLVAAVRSLSGTADAWLDDPTARVAYVFENLPWLPGSDKRAHVQAALRGAPEVAEALPVWLTARVSPPE